MRIFNASVIPTLLYTIETLNMSTEDERRIDAFQNKCVFERFYTLIGSKKSQMIISGV